MAEEERQWLQRHTHEANIVSHGTVGRATYDQQEKTWTFSCEFNNQFQKQDLDIDETVIKSPLKLLSDDAQIVLESTRVESETTSRSQDVAKLARRLPDLVGALEPARHITKHEDTRASLAPVGQQINFGAAIWLLDIQVYEPSNRSVPITASVVGESASMLRFAYVSQRVFDHVSLEGITAKICIPNLVSENASIWSSTEPILQVLFSNRDHGEHSNTFLAVRQASQTLIFQPLRSDAASASGHESLQPNKIISIDLAFTGGHSHADVAFHPFSRKRIAIVDTEGNWSIWHIRGRRSRTARLLYHAQLSTSGKIFSWKHKKRPEGIGLYYDGWHKLLWLSATNSEADRVLVCNRQTVKLFDLQGNEICSIDARLNRTKAFSYIVDVRKSNVPGMCFILTTTKLLLFDITQKEWRDIGRKKGPALLCAWYHYYNSTDLSLNLSTVERGDEVLVAVQSNCMPRLRIYQLRVVKVNGKHSVVSSSPMLMELPMTSKSKSGRILLASVEVRPRIHGQLIKLPQFVEIVVQREDLAVNSFPAVWQPSESTIAQEAQYRPLINLPPRRDSRPKSELRVDLADDEDDEDDLAGFIVPDSSRMSQGASPSSLMLKHPDEIPKTIQLSKHMPEVANHLINLQQASAPSCKPRISLAFADLYEALQGSPNSVDNLISRVLAELFTETPRLDDAEDDSVILSQAIEDLAQQISDKVSISNVGAAAAPSLAETYEELFDRSVSALPPSMPNRARVQREWIIREIALDLQLSNYYIRRQIQETDHGNDLHPAAEANLTLADPTVLSSDAIIFSDPLQAVEPEQIPNIAHIPASQPQPTTSKVKTASFQLPSPSANTSHLQDAISRLSALTTVSPLPSTFIPESAEDHITDLLTHLPNSIDEDAAADADASNPATYDWATAELNIASARALDPSSLVDASDPKAKRKAERLAKARRRADEIRREVARDQERRSVVPTILSSQPQPQSQRPQQLPVVTGEDRARDMAKLVYRNSPAKPKGKVNFDLPTVPTSASTSHFTPDTTHERERERWSQPQTQMQRLPQGSATMFSDPNNGPEQSSQMQVFTQPERGVLGARSGTTYLSSDRDEQNNLRDQRKKKKKVVIPGFG